MAVFYFPKKFFIPFLLTPCCFDVIICFVNLWIFYFPVVFGNINFHHGKDA